MEGLIIAIDGPAGSGKSSVARAVAEELGLVNLNTGAAYRAVALLALREGVDLDDGSGLAGLSRRVSLDERGARVDGEPVSEAELRAPEVSAAASTVSARPEVRSVLLEVQREAAQEGAPDRPRGGARPHPGGDEEARQAGLRARDLAARGRPRRRHPRHDLPGPRRRRLSGARARARPAREGGLN